MAQDDEQKVQPLPIAQQLEDSRRREAYGLMDRAVMLKQRMTGDPLRDSDILKEAIELSSRALGRVNPESGEAAEIRSFLVQTRTEYQMKLLGELALAENTSVSVDLQTIEDLIDNSNQVTSLEQQNVPAIQKVRAVEEREKAITRKEIDLAGKAEDLARQAVHVQIFLNLEGGLTRAAEKSAIFLVSSLKPLFFFTLFVLLFTLLTPPILNWYFNASSLKICTSGVLKISTSSLLQPMLQAEAQKYQQKCSGSTVTVILSNPDGVAEVDSNPAIAIGTAETSAYTTHHQLWDDPVATTIFAMIVNKDAGVSNLTTENIREIYSGTIGNWKQVCYFVSKTVKRCGNDKPINIIGRPINSDVRAIFEQYVLQRSEYITGSIVSDVDTLPKGNGIVQDVTASSGSISYVSLRVAQQAHFLPLSIDGIVPSPASVNNQMYKFWSVEHLYTQGVASGLQQKFIYFLHTDDAISLLHSYGFQSVADISPDALKNHLALNA